MRRTKEGAFLHQDVSLGDGQAVGLGSGDIAFMCEPFLDGIVGIHAVHGASSSQWADMDLCTLGAAHRVDVTGVQLQVLQVHNSCVGFVVELRGAVLAGGAAGLATLTAIQWSASEVRCVRKWKTPAFVVSSMTFAKPPIVFRCTCLQCGVSAVFRLQPATSPPQPLPQPLPQE